MAKITLNIEAENTKDLKATIKDLNTAMNPVPAVQIGIEGDSLAKSLVEAVSEKQKEPEKPKKPATKKKPAPKKEVPVEDSTDSTSDTEPSEAGESQEPIEETPQKSATADHHPGATKADVQALMKKAMSSGHRDAVKTAFQRNNATKLSELAEEDYGVFMTDLEALMEGEK